MFGYIKRAFSHAKESRAARLIYSSSPEAQWSARNYKAFADEGYRKNVVAYQGINKVTSAVAAIPFQLYRRDREVVDHPLLNLLKRPNPMQSGDALMRALTGFYMISGNSYLEMSTNGRSIPIELYALRSDRMRVVPGDKGVPMKYLYTVGGQPSANWEVDPVTGQSDIIHIKTFHPLDDWYGLSPIEAGAFAVDQHNESMKWMQALLQNSAQPSGALELHNDNELSDEAYNRLKAEIEEKYSGAKNAGRPMLLEGGLKWTQMGLSPQDMNIINQKYSSARDVSLALGVPPLLLNIPGDSTYNNYQEARLAFYEETVIPLAQMICEELNNWLVPRFGDGLELRLDLEAIPAIAEKRRELWTMADNSTDLTINERRELKGYEPIPGGDTVYLPATSLPLDTGGNGEGVEQRGLLTSTDLKELAYGPSTRRP